MREFICAYLIEEVPELVEKNIGKGTPCAVIKRIAGTKWLAVFFSKENEGDYAVAAVDESALEYCCEIPEYWVGQLKAKMNDPDFYKKTSLRKMRFKEYDSVELAVEKERYSREGVHKGDKGCIMVDHAINGEWYVIFTDYKTGKDIASLCVKEEDLSEVK